MVSSLCQGFEALVLADVSPGGFNVWNLSSVEGVHILPRQIDKSPPRDRLAMDSLRLHFLKNALSQGFKLTHEAWFQLVIGKILKILEHRFFANWSIKSETITLGE